MNKLSHYFMFGVPMLRFNISRLTGRIHRTQRFSVYLNKRDAV